MRIGAPLPRRRPRGAVSPPAALHDDGHASSSSANGMKASTSPPSHVRASSSSLESELLMKPLISSMASSSHFPAPSSSLYPAPTDKVHDDKAQQRPFMATSAGMGRVAQKQGVRMRDAEARTRVDKRMKEANRRSGVGAESDNHPSKLTFESDDASVLSEEISSGRDGDSLLRQWMRIAGYEVEDAQDKRVEQSKGQEGDAALPRLKYKAPTMMDEREGTLKTRYGIAEGEKSDMRQDGAPVSLAQRIRIDAVRSKEQGSVPLAKSSAQDGSTPYSALPAQGSPLRVSADDNGPPTTYPSPPQPRDDTLQLILPLLVLLSTLLFLLILFVVLVVFVKRRTRIALSEAGGPLDVGREEELDGHGGLDGVEERWLETVDDATRRGYQRAKDWLISFPPGSQSSEITLSQFLTIQEKGVSAWSFDPDYENNPSVYVEGRTEITFLADGQGMTPQEGGGCSVQSNLPLPKLNEVYYWEAKLFTKPEATQIAIGLATKPYPGFRMPGWAKYSVGYFSEDGFKCHNYPFTAQSYGPSFVQGDVIGVGYRPRNGTVFFTRNGKKLEDAFVGLNRYNLFPTVGADGAAEVHINLGQAGFVFIEANVKKWGLAPMVGTLGPPPPYGMERGSILIEAGQGTSSDAHSQQQQPLRLAHRDTTPPPPPTPPSGAAAMSRSDVATRTPQPPARASSMSPPFASDEQTTVLDFLTEDAAGEAQYATMRRGSVSSVEEPHNPPTPHHLDISMHSLHDGLNDAHYHQPRPSPSASRQYRSSTRRGAGTNIASYFPQLVSGATNSRGSSPPPYLDSRHTWAVDHGATGHGAPLDWNDATHGNGSRVPSFASALFGALSERGLLTPLSTRGNHDNATPTPSSTRRHGRSSTRRHAPGPIALPDNDLEQQHFLEQQQRQEEGRSNNAQATARQPGWLASWWS